MRAVQSSLRVNHQPWLCNSCFPLSHVVMCNFPDHDCIPEWTNQCSTTLQDRSQMLSFEAKSSRKTSLLLPRRSIPPGNVMKATQIQWTTLALGKSRCRCTMNILESWHKQVMHVAWSCSTRPVQWALCMPTNGDLGSTGPQSYVNAKRPIHAFWCYIRRGWFWWQIWSLTLIGYAPHIH